MTPIRKLRPDAGLLRRSIIRTLVPRHARPVLRFRRGLGLRELLDNLSEPLLRLGELPCLERGVPEAELDLGQEILDGKKFSDAMRLFAGRREDENRRRP